MSFNFIDRRVPLDIKLKDFFTFTGRQKGTIEKMALKIENMYERCVWNEWSRLIRELSKNGIRRQFYPHKMDALDDMTKNFTIYRREQVNYTKTFEHIFRMEKMQCGNNIVDYQEWHKQTNDINAFILTFASYVSNNTVDEFVEKFKNLQNIRIEPVVTAIQIRIENSFKEEAAEGLLLLRKRDNQLREKEEKKKERQQKKEEEKNNPPPLRRSSRIIKQNQ